MQREIAHNLETGERRTTDVAPGKVKTFSELNLRREILLGLQRKNFVTPTMIQAAAIPIALSRKDMLVQSKSGTGKTLIYAIAALQAYDAQITTPQALVVVPTRELAAQVMETFSYLGEFLPKLKVNYFIGGTELFSDRRRIKNSNIIVGTPGRLLHIYKNNVLCLKNMNLLVLDEADQLYLQDSLHRQVTELIREMPRQVQKIACSATYERNLDELVAKSMDKPVLISNSERATVLLGIRQFVYELPGQINNMEQMNCKLDAVMKIFNLVPYEQVVLFASSKMRADSFRNYLARRGVECHLISGAMSQEERSEVFDCYRYFKMRTLVATDVFARGVDSPHTNLIVNLDPPKDHVDYLHRIGRAGRFGSKGIAITLVYEDDESENFKEILRMAHTGKSVLEFPKEAEKGLDFWNFASYDFPYYIKEEENQQLDEFPKKEGAPKGAGPTEEQAGDAPLKKYTPEEEETSTNDDCSTKIDAPKEAEAKLVKEDTPKIPKSDEKIIDKSAEDKASAEEDSLRNECATKAKEAFQNEDTSKKTDVAEEESGAKSFEKEEPASCASLEQQVALPNQNKPEISVIACHKLKETIRDALMEAKLESGGEEQHPELPQPSVNNETEKFHSVLVENTLNLNNPYSEDKPDEATELILPGKEQPPPIIKVTQLEMENDIEKNKENMPNNRSTQNPEEFVSPELTPSSLTQEHTLTPPAAPVNSINTKTYCLAAPTATSSLTLQAMVISNTVDDASSISSDGSMGSRSESYSSLYSSTDVKQIWKKFLINQRRLHRIAKIQTPKLLYYWSSYTPVPRVRRKREVKIQSPKLNYNWSLYRPVSRVKRKRKVKPMKTSNETVGLLPPQKYFRLIEKIEHSDTFVNSLLRYSAKRRMSNHDANHFLNLLYDAYDETFGFKSSSEPRKSKGNEPHNKLSIRVAHRLNIPPVLVADEDPATDSEANEASQHSEEFNDEEEDFEEEVEEEGNSSSGFVESNESASSGIDTSVYNTQTSTEGDEEYQGSDYDETDGTSSLYGSESPEDELEWEEEEEGEEEEAEEEEEEECEDDSTGSNVSLAGTSCQGSVSAEDEDLRAEESEELETYDDDQQDTLAIYQQIFQTQYQFIQDHVASHVAKP